MGERGKNVWGLKRKNIKKCWEPRCYHNSLLDRCIQEFVSTQSRCCITTYFGGWAPSTKRTSLHLPYMGFVFENTWHELSEFMKRSAVENVTLLFKEHSEASKLAFGLRPASFTELIHSCLWSWGTSDIA